MEDQAPPRRRLAARAAVAHHKVRAKARPAFEFSEHACAFGYAAGEFLHFHQFLMFASGALLVSLGLLLVSRAVDVLFIRLVVEASEGGI
jgi:hypothetical protein